eukprot:s404_g17.t2
MSLEAQSFGASSQTAKKHFQPTKFLQDPVRVTRVTRRRCPAAARLPALVAGPDAAAGAGEAAEGDPPGDSAAAAQAELCHVANEFPRRAAQWQKESCELFRSEVGHSDVPFRSPAMSSSEFGITLQCKLGEKPMAFTVADPMMSSEDSRVNLGNVSTDQPDEILPDDEPPPERAHTEASERGFRDSFRSWTRYDAENRAMAPNRLDHEEWSQQLGHFMTNLQHQQKGFQRYIRQERGEEDSMLERMCALGECGDPSCPTYRPKRPEVRMAVEKCILEKCQSHFKAGTLKTYASIGCGLLGQDWIVLEQLREAGLLPRRAVFVELRTARPVMTCEGAEFPRLSGAGGINLRQTGFMGDLGPEFAFSATLQFEQPIAASLIFEFCNDGQRDRIYAEAGGPEQMGSIRFGAQVGTQSHSFLVEECWDPTERQAHSFLFTVSAVGMYNVFRDGELIGRSYGFAPSTCSRKHLYVGQGHGTKLFSAFRGRIQKIKVWDQEHSKGCGGPNPGDLVPAEEVGNAHQTIAQWYKNEMDVYSFGSLAAYAAACQKDKDARFAADLLLKIDVHDELDGYDDFVCKALDANGLALTLGGPGKSWRRSGTGWLPVDMKCPVLDSAEEKVLAFWNGGPDAMDEASSAVVVRDEALALPSLNANDGVSLEELLEEVDLMATPVLETCGPSLLSQLEALERWEEDGWMDEEDELPGLVVYGR